MRPTTPCVSSGRGAIPVTDSMAPPRFSAERYEQLYAEGARMSLEEAVALALDDAAPQRQVRTPLPADA